MTLLDSGKRDGYYDESGNWQRNKFCFRYCGDRCTCSPPMNIYYSPEHDKRKQEKKYDPKT